MNLLQRTILRSTNGPLSASVTSLFLYLFLLPNILGSGIGPYSFTYLAPLFVLVFGFSLLVKPTFSLRIAGLKEASYFLVLPVMALAWYVVLGTTNALWEFSQLLLGAFTILLLLWILRTAEDLTRTLVMLKVGGVILGLWGLGEFVLGVEPVPLAGYSNTNYLITYMALITPILWVEATGLVGKPKESSGALILFFLAMAFLAGSRANVLAILIQGIIVMWQRLPQRGTKARIVQSVFVLVIMVGAATGTQKIVQQSGDGGLTEQINRGWGSAFIRALMIYDGIQLFIESDGMGVGAGNVTYADSSQPEFGSSSSKDTIYPLHNFILQLAAQYGIPGVLLFAFTYMKLFSGLRQRDVLAHQQNPAVRTVEVIRRSGPAFLISFALISISLSYLFNRRPFYLVFGFYLAVNQYLIRREVESANA